jgi:hypothetical protein
MPLLQLFLPPPLSRQRSLWPAYEEEHLEGLVKCWRSHHRPYSLKEEMQQPAPTLAPLLQISRLKLRHLHCQSCCCSPWVPSKIRTSFPTFFHPRVLRTASDHYIGIDLVTTIGSHTWFT